MQKKEFKDFIKEADENNNELQNSCEQMKERFKQKIEDIKAEHELFKQNYLTDDICEAIKKYSRYIAERYEIIDDEGSFNWYVNFKEQSIGFIDRTTFKDIEHFIWLKIENALDTSFENFGNTNLNQIKNRLLEVERIIQNANKQITKIFDKIKDGIEKGLQADADKFNSITFDDDDTEQVVKKYKVTINIEEV